NAATGLLPKDLPNPPTYRKTNPADRPVLIYAIHSDALPIYRIDDYAYTILAQKLATVKGVSESRIFGQKQYAVHIEVHPGRLARVWQFSVRLAPIPFRWSIRSRACCRSCRNRSRLRFMST